MDLPNALSEQIPYYLTNEQKSGLITELENFKNCIRTDYFSSISESELLQGDGWSGFDVVNFESGDKKKIRGIILSNTCDMSDENIRFTPTRITFAPLIKLSSYSELLSRSGCKQEQINSKVDAIRRQVVTELVYLPQGAGLETEYIAMLADVQSLPYKLFESSGNREKLFSLSMFGFYMFLFKLSIHYCRFHENLER